MPEPIVCSRRVQKRINLAERSCPMKLDITRRHITIQDFLMLGTSRDCCGTVGGTNQDLISDLDIRLVLVR
jgi:hypothetical protein